MTDNLTVFGKNFTGVNGIKAKETGDGMLAYIRPQGSKSITANGTGIDVAAYATVNVSVSGGGSNLQAKTNISPTTSSQTITPDSGYDGLSSVQINAMPSGTAGTPTATKGSVSNHAISVTPSVTNSSGYISGGTKTGTAVSVSASELVSGNLAITENGTNIDCSNYATCSVNVSGGGSSDVQVAEGFIDSYTTTSLTFTDLLGEPTSYWLSYDGDIATSSTAKLAALVYDGSSFHGQTITNTSNAQVSYLSTGFSHQYSNGTLIITTTNAQTPDGNYMMCYTYNGTSGNIQTEDVQVGSGATSITFTGLEDEPVYWSCIFKSNFSTSSGYQRVIVVTYDGENLNGMDMDSSAHSAGNWSANYSNGSLTITSRGTNQGGYFHQPGYYQLTYAVSGGGGNYQSKTVTPTTSQQVVTADASYDALSSVTVNAIPSSYVQPTTTVGATTYRASTSSQTIQAGTYHSAAATIAAVTQTNLTAANIKNGTTITISNGQSNLWSVTGTYTGGGGGSSTVATTTATASGRPTSLAFTVSGEPIAFFCRCTSGMSRSSSSTYYYVADMRYNGTNTTGNCWRMSNGNWTNITSGYSFTYSNGTLTLSSNGTSTSSPGSFYNNGTYELVYVY